MREYSLLILSLVIGTFCTAQDVTSFAKDNISFEYPSHWVNRDMPGQYILVSEPPKEELSFMATFDVAVDTTKKSSKQFCSDYEAMMTSNEVFSEFQIVEKEKIEFQGVDAFELHCKATAQYLPLEWRSIIFKRDGVVYKLTTTAIIGQYLLLQDETRRIFESFKLE